MHINIWLESLIPTFSPRQPSCVQAPRLTLLSVCFTFRRGFFLRVLEVKCYIHGSVCSWMNRSPVSAWQCLSYMWEQLWSHDSWVRVGPFIDSRKTALLWKTFHCAPRFPQVHASQKWTEGQGSNVLSIVETPVDVFGHFRCAHGSRM